MLGKKTFIEFPHAAINVWIYTFIHIYATFPLLESVGINAKERKEEKKKWCPYQRHKCRGRMAAEGAPRAFPAH